MHQWIMDICTRPDALAILRWHHETFPHQVFFLAKHHAYYRLMRWTSPRKPTART
jgi:hypothetical protein